MTRTLQAVYENGAFRPLEPVSCREQERVFLTVESIMPTEDNQEFPANQEMLAALQEIEMIQKGMNPKAGKATLEYLREAREGGLYGYRPDDD